MLLILHLFCILVESAVLFSICSNIVSIVDSGCTFEVQEFLKALSCNPHVILVTGFYFVFTIFVRLVFGVSSNILFSFKNFIFNGN